MGWRLTLIAIQALAIIILLNILIQQKKIKLTFTDEEIANAIYQAEGGTTTRFPYGIMSIDTHGDVAVARKICLATIRHSRVRWNKAGRPGNFISFLGRTYAPQQPEWVKNVNWFLKDARRTK